MEKAKKFRGIPIFTKEDSGGIHRLFAFLAYFFPIGTLIMWLLFRKKSKFIKMHAESCFDDYFTIFLATVSAGLLAGIVSLIMGSMGRNVKIIGIIFIVFGVIGAIIDAFFLIMMLVSMVRALFGKLESNKVSENILRDQLALGNPEAIEIINTDARFADILAEYNANSARAQDANDGGDSNE